MKLLKSTIKLTFLFLLAQTSINATVWVYPGIEEYESSKYLVKVHQNDEVDTSFVYQHQTQDGASKANITDYNHWTTFSFEDSIQIEVIKLTGSLGSCEIFPLRDSVESQISGDTLKFSIKEPLKLYLKFANEYDHPLFIFADKPETYLPDENADSVLLVPAGMDSLSYRQFRWANKDKHVIYFEPGVHDIGGQDTIRTGDTYYLPGGAYVKGTILGQSISNAAIRGRGILSNIGFPRMESSKNMHWNAIFFGGGVNQYVEGITVTHPAHFNILSRGTMHVQNVKMFSSYVQTDGFGGGDNSIIEECFLKVNDDHMKFYNSNMVARDIVTYQQSNGAILQFGWTPPSGLAENCHISEIDIIASEVTANDRAAIEFKANSGKTVRNYTITDIRCDQDLWRLIDITHDSGGGLTTDFRINDFHVKGIVKQQGDFIAEKGEISNFYFNNLKINGELILDMNAANFHINDNGGAGTIKNILFSANSFPECEIVVPTVDTVIEVGDDLHATIEANSEYSAISKVELYINDLLIDTDTDAPYNFVTNNLAGGVNKVEARAYDVDNVYAISLPLKVTVPVPIPVPVKINAMDFISSFNVQLEGGTDPLGGAAQHVAFIENGSWCEYKVNVPQTKTYDFNFRVAAKKSGGIEIYKDTQRLGGVEFPAGGTWTSWANHTTSMELPEGVYVIRTLFTSSQTSYVFNFNWMDITEPLSVNSALANNLYSVYPNPFKNEFVIALNSSESFGSDIKLMDLNSKQVEAIIEEHGSEIHVKLSDNVTPGLYVVQIKNEEGTFYQKVMKQ